MRRLFIYLIVVTMLIAIMPDDLLVKAQSVAINEVVSDGQIDNAAVMVDINSDTKVACNVLATPNNATPDVMQRALAGVVIVLFVIILKTKE